MVGVDRADDDVAALFAELGGFLFEDADMVGESDAFDIGRGNRGDLIMPDDPDDADFQPILGHDGGRGLGDIAALLPQNLFLLEIISIDIGPKGWARIAVILPGGILLDGFDAPVEIVVADGAGGDMGIIEDIRDQSAPIRIGTDAALPGIPRVNRDGIALRGFVLQIGRELG